MSTALSHRRSALAALLCLATSATPATTAVAETLTYQFQTDATQTTGVFAAVVPIFDSSLGTLNSMSITATTYVSPATYYGAAAGPVRVDVLSRYDVQVFGVTQTQQVIDFVYGYPEYPSYYHQTVEGYGEVTNSPPTWITGFQGSTDPYHNWSLGPTGQLWIYITENEGGNILVPYTETEWRGIGGALQISGDGTAVLDGAITYNYIAAPEPPAVTLLCTAILVLGGAPYLRRRRRPKA